MEYDKPEMVDFNANFRFGECSPGSGDSTSCNGHGDSAGSFCYGDGNNPTNTCMGLGNGN